MRAGMGRYVMGVFVVMTFSIRLLGQQIANDDIQNRIILEIGSLAISSKTNNSTVQADCISKSLTKKCLNYHNDQWFAFTPKQNNVAYLLIQKQKCRDLKGVQVVVLEGDPCKTSTYKVKKCIDFSDQADFFVVLDSLINGTEYLINIDGFLGDHCSFEILLTDKSVGLPIDVPALSGCHGDLMQKDSIVKLSWNFPQHADQEPVQFLIYRKKSGETASKHIRLQNHDNSLSAVTSSCSVTDTLHEHGSYVYTIYMTHGEKVASIKKFVVQFEGDTFYKFFLPNQRSVIFYVDVPEKVDITVTKNNGERLQHQRTDCSRGLNSVLLDFDPFVTMGVKNFEVVVKGEFIEENRTIVFK
jgi:hypothetical protein